MFGWLLFDRQRAAVLIEVDNPEALRVFDQIAEHRGTRRLLDGTQQLFAEALAVEDVVAQDQADRIVANEFFTDQEGLGQPIRRRLFGVAQFDTELAAVAQQLFVLGQVVRGGNQQDFPNTGEHQHRDRVVDHRLVVDRQQLLGNTQGNGVQASAGAAGEDYPFHADAPSRSRW
ncbi:hypothetical protein D9M71_451580 [compost metagenome]